MESILKNIAKEYFIFMQMSTEEKLHSGEILGKCARDLLEIDKNELENKVAVQRGYIIKKVADDLLNQARDMGMTKQYDCSPKIKEYTYLAFDLMNDLFDSKASRNLLPFLRAVIYYESYNDNKDYLNKLKILLIESIELNHKFLDYLRKTQF